MQVYVRACTQMVMGHHDAFCKYPQEGLHAGKEGAKQDNHMQQGRQDCLINFFTGRCTGEDAHFTLKAGCCQLHT